MGSPSLSSYSFIKKKKKNPGHNIAHCFEQRPNVQWDAYYSVFYVSSQLV